MKLVIVESPTKAKTINKFLGKDYLVKSSFGHVRDLPKGKLGVDVEHDFKPKYIIIAKASQRVEDLKEKAKKADSVILATDEDREGEAIAWHLVKALNLEKLKSESQDSKKKIERIVFHEITEQAIKKALDNPRNIDMNLVNTQQARRILDRLVGYELSPFLWKVIRRGLSAGRVQSIALRLIVEREQEIKNFKPEKYWVISLSLKKKDDKNENKFDANLIEKDKEKIEKTLILKLFAGDYKTKKTIIDNKETTDDIVADLKESEYEVSNVIGKEIQRTPPPPFTTSTLQQTSINSLGFSSKQTMMIAQKLYEEGLITYMRTDSVSLSLQSKISAKKVIEKEFGEEYALKVPRFYKTKTKGAQEAHEAIRPAYPQKLPKELKKSLEPHQYKLYNLIWKRMIASQMQSAIINSIRADIKAQNKETKKNYLFRANGSTIKFKGFLKVFGEKTSTTEKILPILKIEDQLELVSINPEEKLTSSPPRYSEAALIKALEEHGIGRPSTYTPIISTIIKRNYVDKNEGRKLYPLEIGSLVSNLLVEHFSSIVNLKFTAQMEKNLDEIAEGKKEWLPVVRDFYEPFHKKLKEKTKEVKKEDVLEKLDRECPKCGSSLIVKFGRFGKFIACSNFPKCKYSEQTEEEKKIGEENSGEICEKCGKPMKVKAGPFGKFLACSGYPECKNTRPLKKEKHEVDKTCPECGAPLEVRNGRYGKFLGCSDYPKCKHIEKYKDHKPL